jgi:hypothetical protein
MAADAAAAWAGSLRPLLANVLESDEHADALLAHHPTPLLVAHVVALFNLTAGKRKGGDWMVHFEGRASRAVALHMWLFAFGGGDAAKLARPAQVESYVLYKKIERQARPLSTRRSDQLSTRTSALLLQAQTEQLESELMEEFNFELLPQLNTDFDVDMTDNGGGDGGEPGSGNTVESLNVSDLRWLVARGAAYVNSPLRALGGQSDILSNICKLACNGGMVYWRPAPQADRLRTVEQQLYLAHDKCVSLTEQLTERDTLIEEARTEVRRAERREAHSDIRRGKAERAVEVVREQEQERFDEFVSSTRKYIRKLERANEQEKKEMQAEWEAVEEQYEQTMVNTLGEMDRSRRG